MYNYICKCFIAIQASKFLAKSKWCQISKELSLPAVLILLKVFCLNGKEQNSWIVRCFVTQLCLTLCNPTDCSLPDSSVHGILQARILEWVAISFLRGSYQLRDRTQVSCIAGRFFTIWATSKAWMDISRYRKNFNEPTFKNKYWG